MYEDVKTILDAALAANGGTFELATHGKAVHWRQRAYKFRKLYAEVHGVKTASKYDRLTLRKIAEGSSTVVISIMAENMRGVFTPSDPNFVPPGEVADDDLLNFAENLAKKIQGEI